MKKESSRKWQLKASVFLIVLSSLFTACSFAGKASKTEELSHTELLGLRTYYAETIEIIYQRALEVILNYPFASAAVILQDEGLKNLFGDLVKGESIDNSMIQLVGGATFCAWNEENKSNCNAVDNYFDELSESLFYSQQQVFVLDQKLNAIVN